MDTEFQKEERNYIIIDRLNNYVKNTDVSYCQLLTILNEIIFYGIIVYYYYYNIQDVNSFKLGTPNKRSLIIIKYIVTIFIFRYLFNYITNVSVSTINKEGILKVSKMYQINSKVAIFAILILLIGDGHIFNIKNVILIMSYAIFSSIAKYGYTIDNINTVILSYSVAWFYLKF